MILGVSVDTADSHKQFCTKDGLTFHLLADPEHKVVDEYGSLGNFGTWTIANRNTFLIDPAGQDREGVDQGGSLASLRRSAGCADGERGRRQAVNRAAPINPQSASLTIIQSDTAKSCNPTATKERSWKANFTPTLPSLRKRQEDSAKPPQTQEESVRAAAGR